MKRTGSFPSTRERLLDAAAPLMLARGFAGTSVEAVCRGAGLTKGAFFHHFASKEGLAGALVERWSAAREEEHAAWLAHGGTPAARLRRYADSLSASAKAGALTRGCLIATFAAEMQEVEPVRRACERAFAGWVRQLEAPLRGVPGGGRRARLTAESFVARLEGAILLSKAYADPGPILRACVEFKRALPGAGS